MTATAADNGGDRLLLDTLRALEVELHHPGAGCSAERLQALLHPQFHEVGRSGVPYDRETVARYLAGRPAGPQVQSHDFAVSALAPGVALLTYRSTEHRDGPGAPPVRTWRSSLWMRSAAGWQLRYHQGTPAAAGP